VIGRLAGLLADEIEVTNGTDPIPSRVNSRDEVNRFMTSLNGAEISDNLGNTTYVLASLRFSYFLFSLFIL